MTALMAATAVLVCTALPLGMLLVLALLVSDLVGHARSMCAGVAIGRRHARLEEAARRRAERREREEATAEFDLDVDLAIAIASDHLEEAA